VRNEPQHSQQMLTLSRYVCDVGDKPGAARFGVAMRVVGWDVGVRVRSPQPTGGNGDVD
jgi:hypothetical protein